MEQPLIPGFYKVVIHDIVEIAFWTGRAWYVVGDAAAYPSLTVLSNKPIA